MSTCRVLGRVLSAHCTAFRGLGRRRMLPEPRVLHQLAWCPAGLGQAGGPGPSEGSVCAAAQECAFHARGPGSDLRLAVRICFTPGVAAVASCLSLPQLVSVSGACRQSSSLGGKIRFGLQWAAVWWRGGRGFPGEPGLRRGGPAVASLWLPCSLARPLTAFWEGSFCRPSRPSVHLRKGCQAPTWPHSAAPTPPL